MVRHSLKTDQIVDNLMGRVLQIGVVLAAAIVFAGGMLYLAHHRSLATNHTTFTGEPAPFRTLSGIMHGALSLDGRGLIQFGLLVLVATPIARVCFSILAFFYQRDWKYVAFTLVVLSLLLYSLLQGLG